MLWLNILCKYGGVICDVIYIYKHCIFNKRRQDYNKSIKIGKGWSALTM